MANLQRVPIHTLAVSALVLFVFALTSASEELFFVLVAHAHSAAPWKPFTAHLVHTDQVHLAMNLCAFTVLATLLERVNPAYLWAAFAAGCATIALWFHWQTDIDYYCGLSGVLCTMFVLVLAVYHQPDVPLWSWTSGGGNAVLVILGVLFLAKLITEYQSGYRIASAGLWPSAPEAHLAGAVAGLSLAVFKGALSRSLVIFQPASDRVSPILSETGDRAHRVHPAAIKQT